MLDKLATCDIEDVMLLFSLTDKCARTADGWTWLSRSEPKAQGAAVASPFD
jgi:hypothetical protein